MVQPPAPDLMPRIVFPANHKIFNEGGIGDVAYVVVTGEVEIAHDVKAQRKVLGVIKSGGMFGEMALIDGAPRMAEAVTIHETTCMVIRRDVFESKIKMADPFIKGLLRILVNNVRSMADG